MAEWTFLETERVRRAREKLAAFWEGAADLVTKELAVAKKKKHVPEDLVAKAKTISDQIRRDFKLDEPAESKPEQPLAGLRVVSEDEEAA